VTDIAKCNNPTFSKDGSNTLAKNAPMPEACDKKGATQCTAATGGAAGAGSGSGSSRGIGDGGSGGGFGGSGGGGFLGIPVGTGPVTCNADTGVCQNVTAEATNIDNRAGWGLPQTVMLVAVALFLMLVFLPPVLVRSIRRGGRGS